MRRLALLITIATAVVLASSAGGATALPHVKHVFVIVLENENYASTFGDPAADPYLAKTLPAKGALLTQYYGTGHESNDNYIAMVSGEGPNPQNQADCQYFDDFVGSGATAVDGQADPAASTRSSAPPAISPAPPPTGAAACIAADPAGQWGLACAAREQQREAALAVGGEELRGHPGGTELALDPVGAELGADLQP